MYAGGEKSNGTPKDIVQPAQQKVKSSVKKLNIVSKKTITNSNKSKKESLAKLDALLENSKKNKLKFDTLIKKNKLLQERIKSISESKKELGTKYDQILDLYNSTKRTLQNKRNNYSTVNDKFLEVKQQLEDTISENNKLKKEIDNLLSSDVDIWKVIENKTKILEKFKKDVISKTNKNVLLLRNSLEKAQLKIQVKKRELELAKGKILEKYADKNRILSKLVDDKLYSFTTQLDALRAKIERLKEKSSLATFDAQVKLKSLLKKYQQRLSVNESLRKVDITRVEKEISELEEQYKLKLNDKSAIVEPLEKELEKLKVDYKKNLIKAEKDFKNKTVSIKQKINQLKLSHKEKLKNMENSFFNSVNDSKVKLNSLKIKIDKAEEFMALVNRTADQRLAVLKQGREIEKNDFFAKQKNLKNRIAEADEATKEIKENTEDRKAILEIRKANIKEDMKLLSKTEALARKSEIAVIDNQIKALEETFKSVYNANNNIKLVFSKSLKSQEEANKLAEKRYIEKSKQIDNKRKSIVKGESQRISKLKKNYQQLSQKVDEIQSNYDKDVETENFNYKGNLKKLENNLLALKVDFDKTIFDNKEKYKETLSRLKKTIEKNKINRSKLLRQLKTKKTILVLKKAKINRSFDLLKRRIESVFESDKRAINASMLATNQKLDKEISILRDKERDIMELKDNNESLYQRKIEQYKYSKENSLEKIKFVENDLDELSKKISKETKEQILSLEESKNRAVSKFEVSLANLEKAQKAFEVFVRAQKRLKTDRNNTSEMIASIMENFQTLTGEKISKPSFIKSIKRSANQQRNLKPKTKISLLENLVKKLPYSPKYVDIKGGCFIADILTKTEKNVKKCVGDFQISNHEVTNKEYKKYQSNHDSGEFKNNSLNNPFQPVVNVSWLDAIEYAKWLSKNDNNYNYRLPTDLEWEYAARGGVVSGKTFYDKESDACFYANVSDETAKKYNPTWDTHQCLDEHYVSSNVGNYKENGYGLFDMLGNVWEWTCPIYEKLITGELSCVGVNAPKDDLKVSRGGSWFSSPKSVRFGFKYGNYADFRGKHIGLRLVRTKK
ncbi:protein of unknown function DUF323 [hydrothermal vent metagenome]|uniref:Sulfatase-modifying factor enzyme-like domain-containing protein n=1 Tax=hydrothermal vent metagenome TaxID=652676 RepID=A0A1W1CKC1_9ZZZZ